MKFAALTLILLSSSAFAMILPDPLIVDRYIEVAQKTDVKTLQGKKAKWECQFEAIHDSPDMVAWAKTPEEASQRLQLVCIKSQCSKIGSIIQSGVDDLRMMPMQQFRDLLEFAGKSREEIDRALEERKKAAVSSNDMTCETAPEMYRTFAFDSCFSVPVTCRKR